jgi:hypothetical protein
VLHKKSLKKHRRKRNKRLDLWCFSFSMTGNVLLFTPDRFSFVKSMASKVWLSIRDLFLGQNGTKQDVNRALVLACFCSHPDADWLLRACAKYNVRTLAHARDAFRQEKQDARSLCFAWHLDENRDLSVLKQAVEMGDSFAMATMVNFTTQDAEFAKLARLSAAAGERLGQHFWAVCLLAGIDTEVNEEVGKRVAITAAENGEMNAMVRITG